MCIFSRRCEKRHSSIPNSSEQLASRPWHAQVVRLAEGKVAEGRESHMANTFFNKMQKYNKEQLSGMSREELVRIGHEFGIRATGMDTIDIIYEILDRSAMAAATSAEQPEPPTRKLRARIKVTPVQPTTDSTKKAADNAKSASPAPAASNTADAEVKPVKRRGRPRKVVAPEPEPVQPAANQGTNEDFFVVEMTADGPILVPGPQQAATADTTPSTSKAKASAAKTTPAAADKQPVPVPAPPQPITNAAQMESLPAEEEDFIIIEDLPSSEGAFQPSYDEPPLISAHFEPEQMAGAAGYERQPHPAKADNPHAGAKKAVTMRFYDFGDLITASGLLEVTDNCGFLRSADYNYLPSPDDIYITPQQLKQYGLKTGDVVEGSVQPPRDNERYFTLRSVSRINGCDPSVIRDRIAFEYLTPIFPQEKFQLCSDDKTDSTSSRIVDLFTPIGKGQRALIVAQPKTGKTLLMKDIANSIAKHHPEAYLIMLLIDERPEEVTDMARTVNAEVVASTFDAPAENHVKIAGLVLEKAKRMVECGHDVVIFLDSITRLARAYNTVAPTSGKVLSGGVDANALQKPKRFFGAARNIENGGSLTIIATALIDTGSKMDEVIFEEFKGTGNMELQLDRTLANKRIFPAVNLVASSTRRDELLHDDFVVKRMWVVRKHLADMTSMEAMDIIKGMVEKTITNNELLISINS